jgi:capsular polysaccharide transport system permease protein
MKNLTKYLNGEATQIEAVPSLAGPAAQTAPRRLRHALDPRSWPKSLLIAVIIPSLLAIAYFGFIAAPRYVSHAEIVIRSSDSEGASNMLGAALSGLTGGMGGGGAALAASETAIMAEYVHSQSKLRQLQNEVDLRAMWTDDAADMFSRLSSNASQEAFLDYYRDRITVEFQPGSTVVSISGQAFSPEAAQTVVSAIVRLSENLLNEISRRQQADNIDFARTEVAMAEERIRESRMQMSAYRETHGDVDPAQSAAATGQIMMGLAQQLIDARAELAATLNVRRPTSPEVQAIKARIRAMDEQMAAMRERMAPTVGDLPVYSKLVEWEKLLTEHELALKSYESAATFLESARLKASQQNVYIVDFVPANLPDSAEQPERIKAILAVVVGAFLAWAIGGLLISAIREQGRG